MNLKKKKKKKKGETMGCSNPHPHGQVWASDQIPEELFTEIESFKDYKNKKSRCLLCDYLKLELNKKERIVAENDSFVVLVPFWAYWPFEVMVLPRQHYSLLSQLDEKQITLHSPLELSASKRSSSFTEPPII